MTAGRAMLSGHNRWLGKIQWRKGRSTVTGHRRCRCALSGLGESGLYLTEVGQVRGSVSLNLVRGCSLPVAGSSVDAVIHLPHVGAVQLTPPVRALTINGVPGNQRVIRRYRERR